MRIRLLSILLFVTSMAYAQEGYTVRGTLREVASKNPVPFATVAAFADDVLISGATSDIDGKFLITNLKKGNYSFEIQFVGYESKTLKGVNVTKNIDLGTLELSESSTVLNELVVTGEAIRKPIEITAEGITVNPGQNISNAGGSALDVLRNTPSVNVDAEGGISLRGSNSTNILINGRNSSVSANLDQIPASAIKSIKIINNPGAKYDADAKGGIINIELKKGDDLGTHGNAEISMGTAGRYNGSIQVSHQTTRFNIYGGYDIQRPVRQSKASIFRETFGDSPQTLQQQAETQRTSLNQNLKIGGDYFVGKNQFTYEGLLSTGKDNDIENRISNLLSFGDTEPEIINRNNVEKEDGYAFDNAFIYQRTFDKEDQVLKALVSNSSRNNLESQRVSSESYRANTLETALEQKGTTEEMRNISVVQIDYTHPFRNKAKIETGYKTVVRMFDTNFLFENQDASGNEWVVDTNVSNRFKYQEAVHAAYLTYAKKFERLSLAFGNRLELTTIKTRLFNNNQRNKQQYFNIFPSANFQYKLSEKQELRFTYSKRIDRPGGGRLNPFPDIADSLNIRSGNPQLQPEYIQSLELGQHLTLGRFDFTTTLFYRYTTGIIDYIVRVEDGISYGRPENLNNGHDTGVELIAITPLTKWLNINLGYSLFQRSVDGSNVSAEFTNKNLSWNTKVVADVTLPASFKFQVTGNYESPEIEAQGEDFARYNVDMSLLKSLWNGKGKVSLSFRDVFNTLKFGGTAFAEGFRQERNVKAQTRIVFLNLSFKL